MLPRRAMSLTTRVEVVISRSSMGWGTGPAARPSPGCSAQRFDVGDHLGPRGLDGLLLAFDARQAILDGLHDGRVFDALVGGDVHGLGAVGKDLADGCVVEVRVLSVGESGVAVRAHLARVVAGGDEGGDLLLGSGQPE